MPCAAYKAPVRLASLRDRLRASKSQNYVVELSGIEPLASAVRLQRSPI